MIARAKYKAFWTQNWQGGSYSPLKTEYFPGFTSLIANLTASQKALLLLTLKTCLSGGKEATFTISSMPGMYRPTATTKISTPVAFRASALGIVRWRNSFDWPSVTSKTILFELQRRPLEVKKKYFQLFSEYHSSYDKLLNNINRPSLHNRRIHDMLTLVYKSFHGLAPSYINELLIERNSSYNLRGKHSLSIPRVQSTKYGLHSFRYSASKYWNMLPEVLRTAESLHVFKSKIKSISFANKCCSFVLSFNYHQLL